MPPSTDFADRCLPGDVEVLTDRGWRRGIDVRDGDRLATWDPVTGDVTVEPVGGVETGRYHGPVISIAGGVASTAGNPERGVWVRMPVTDDLETWTHWHLRSLADLAAVTTVRIPVAGHRSGPGLRGDAGDYAGVLGWISLEEGYHGTSVQIRSTGSNHHRAAATAGRLEALGARMKRVPGRNGTTAQAWFLPGPLTVGIRRDLDRGLAAWPSVWQMNSVELHAFVDGAVGGRRHSLHRLAPDTVDLLQAVGALTGHRTVAHDVGRRAGATVDMSIGLDAPVPRRSVRHRTDTWDGPSFALTTRTGAVIARRNWRVFIAAT